MGNRPRGLQRRRRRVGIVHPRPGSLTGLPMERGRARRHLRRRPDVVHGVRLLERTRPDPEGAALRPHRARGQPRRGRQGVLVLRGLAHRRTRGCVGGTSIRRASSPIPNSSPRTPSRGYGQPEFELLDTGVFDDDRYWDITIDFAKAETDDIVVSVEVRNAGPDAATLHVLADAVVPQHVVVGARRSQTRTRRRRCVICCHITTRCRPCD